MILLAWIVFGLVFVMRKKARDAREGRAEARPDTKIDGRRDDATK